MLSPASAVADSNYLDQYGGKIITVGILISVFGCINGYLLTGPRITYTLGTTKIYTRIHIFGKLNKNGVPANATLFMAAFLCYYMHYQDNSTY